MENWKKENLLEREFILLVVDICLDGCINQIVCQNQNFPMECEMKFKPIRLHKQTFKCEFRTAVMFHCLTQKYLLKCIFNWSTLILLELRNIDYQERIEYTTNLSCKVQLIFFYCRSARNALMKWWKIIAHLSSIASTEKSIAGEKKANKTEHIKSQ